MGWEEGCHIPKGLLDALNLIWLVIFSLPTQKYTGHIASRKQANSERVGDKIDKKVKEETTKNSK